MQHSIIGHKLGEPKPVNRKSAFTLIELLVVIAIIALLAAILFPVFAQAKEAAKKATCLSNMKQLSLASLMYANDYDDVMVQYSFEYLDPPTNTLNLGRYPFFSQLLDFGGSGLNELRPGLLDAYLKAFSLTGCATGADLLTNITFSPKDVGLLSITFNGNLNGRAVSDIQEHANTVFSHDNAVYRTVARGYPADGVFTTTGYGNTASDGCIHGRHNGKVNLGWVDGHVKSMPVNLRDCECNSSNAPFGVTKAMLDKYKIGWLCPPGMVAQAYAGIAGQKINWAVSILNDPKCDNYLILKKR